MLADDEGLTLSKMRMETTENCGWMDREKKRRESKERGSEHQIFALGQR